MSVTKMVETSDESCETSEAVLVSLARMPLTPPDDSSCWIWAWAVERKPMAVRICSMSE